MPSERVTIRLQTDERTALSAYTRHVGATENYVVRLALRKFLGLPHAQPDDVTPVTRNQERK